MYRPDTPQSSHQSRRASVLSEWVVQFITKEMTKPENKSYALSWKQLHLSRAKLKASSRTSALLSGFAMVAMVEVQLSANIPDGLLIAFSICTTLLVSVHMLALMISTCLLPNIEAIACMQGITTVAESPHDSMQRYVEVSWAFSTVFGILLFLGEIAILCWVKFYDFSSYAAIAASMVLVPVVILFVAFAVHFYQKLVSYKYERSARGLRELENMVLHLNDETGNGAGHNGPYIVTI